eukprot:6586323-Pyramimonas_sp.AAC.1
MPEKSLKAVLMSPAAESTLISELKVNRSGASCRSCSSSIRESANSTSWLRRQFPDQSQRAERSSRVDISKPLTTRAHSPAP